MNQQYDIIEEQIRRVRSRWIALVLLKGAGQVLAAMLAAVFLVMTLDAFAQLEHWLRFVLMLALVTGMAVLTIWVVLKPLARIPDESVLARFLEEQYPDLDDRLVTAIELRPGEISPFSENFLQRLFEDTRTQIAPLNLPKTLSAKSGISWSVLSLISAAALVGFFLMNLEQNVVRINRIVNPWRYPNIRLGATLTVEPGNVRIPVGQAQEVVAQVSGYEPESVVLYYSDDDSTWEKSEMDITPSAGRFVYRFFDLRENMKYYVKAGNRLSDIYQFSLYSPPTVTRVDLT
jgi:hypothetical protein